MRIAIMQPYFLPYAGYFRLLAGTELFVVLDDVQFPRTGWVHRNRLARRDGRPAWITLPLATSPRETRIRDLQFHPRVDELWPEQLRAFPACTKPVTATTGLVEATADAGGNPADFVVRLLGIVADLLGFRPDIARSSELEIPAVPGRSGRLIAICQRFGASRYLNAPNGRALYDEAEFAAHGIALEFLPDYVGSHLSILQRLHDQPLATIRQEILANMD